MKAFALPSYGDGYIRFNLKGREKNGIVERKEIEGLTKSLAEKLLKLSDPVSGELLVQDIIIPKENLKGITTGNLPDADLIVLWKHRLFEMVKDDDSVIIGPVPFGKSGSHRPTGFIIGEGLASVQRPPIASAQVIDVAPTILGLLNLPIPPYMKGQQLFKEK